VVWARGAQAALGYQHTTRGQQSHLKEVAPAGEPGGDEFAPVIGGLTHFFKASLGNFFAEYVEVHALPPLRLAA
jgi:hypothetical protein